MNKLMELLKQKDARVHRVLQDQDLKPQYFAFRWITLLLSQEFNLPGIGEKIRTFIKEQT